MQLYQREYDKVNKDEILNICNKLLEIDPDIGNREQIREAVLQFRDHTGISFFKYPNDQNKPFLIESFARLNSLAIGYEARFYFNH
ncbi:MAG: hypothetical protein LBR15_06375 [Methanobrevibacter sp.]|nr:hypothetical protein [Candidatus Methanovirga australis]